MDTVDPVRILVSFILVVGLIGGLAVLLKYMAASKKWPLKGMTHNSDDSRIQIIETRYLDPRRKIVLVRRDDVEHVLLLADGREQVIESSIPVKMREAENE